MKKGRTTLRITQKLATAGCMPVNIHLIVLDIIRQERQYTMKLCNQAN